MKSEKPVERCLGVVEVSKRLSVSVKSVRRMIWNGALPASKVGTRVVILESDLNAFVSSLPPVH